MTDLSNISVEKMRFAAEVWKSSMGASEHEKITDLIDEIERLRTLQARVEELTAKIHNMHDTHKMTIEEIDDAKAEGRLQGLDEALSVVKVVRTSADSDRVHAAHRDELWEALGKQRAAGNAVAAIEALKEQTND
jgi:hypothetical protein